MTIQEIENRLQELRFLYSKEKDIDMKKVIVAQAKCLKIVLAGKGQTNLFSPQNSTYENAKEVFSQN